MGKRNRARSKQRTGEVWQLNVKRGNEEIAYHLIETDNGYDVSLGFKVFDKVATVEEGMKKVEKSREKMSFEVTCSWRRVNTERR